MADLGGGCRGCAPPTPPPEMTCGFLIQLVFHQKKTMWFIGVEVEQETSAPPPKKNPGSAPGKPREKIGDCDRVNILGPTRKRWGRGAGGERKTDGFSHCPSPPPPSFSSLTTVQLSRVCISYLTSHKRKNSQKKTASHAG